MPPPFPVIDVGRAAASESTRALCEAALGDIPGLALAAPLMNAVSRRFLRACACSVPIGPRQDGTQGVVLESAVELAGT